MIHLPKPQANRSAAAAVLALIIAAGAVGYWWVTAGSPEAKVRAAVRQRLKDPDSARFGPITIGRRSGAACGSVNARNAMGGYVGDTPFILFADGELRFFEAGAGEDAEKKALLFYDLTRANCVLHQS